MVDVARDQLTRTEQAALLRDSRTRHRHDLRTWWRRRPIRRALVLVHRWPSLILGLFLVVECTSGAILLYHGDYFRVTHSALYRHTASAHPLTADQAIAKVNTKAPTFAAQWAAKDDGAWLVGNASYELVYGVDPGTGAVTGPAKSEGGFMGLLVNIHDCALTCATAPGYLPALAEPVAEHGSWLWRNVSWLREITWAGLILGVLGLLLVLLCITGIATWWPGRKRLSHGFRVRTRKGRFARDYDLHNVLGILAVPFLLMWGITGAALEFPVVEKAWLAVTGGDPTPPEAQYFIVPNKATLGQPRITTAQALDAALTKVPGEATWIGLPTKDTDYYEIDIKTGYGSDAHRAIYTGDAYVYIDAHDASHLVVNDNGTGPAANRFYDKFLEPSHFGWNVNSWWRLIWLVFGLAPLALMITGISTWLFRRKTKKQRKKRHAEQEAAKAAGTDERAPDDAVDATPTTGVGQ